ncbi:NAD(P)-binding protein [Lentithecium fluviatile CBS 122367]|uniref:NAD(P)-binding protein n=1 Tax=Lentithecium fluviatile CBS 122367 TaxID=1168545 RepID=A0A6G1JMA5_9PLEO|nr:NAD(P)-binding protein [Lentithecium fluviatile CBS 122367]
MFAAEPCCTRVVVASRNPNKFRIRQAEYRPCDLRYIEEVKALFQDIQPKIIIHTISPGPFAQASEQYEVTYFGTKRVLELAKLRPSVRAFVWTSSVNSVELDSTTNHRPINEAKATVTDWTSRASAYGRAKGSTETLVLGSNTDATAVDFSDEADWRGKLLTMSLRVTGLYGPRDKTSIKDILSLVNTIATRTQIGPNKLVHSWCYVDSAANAHVYAAKALLDAKHLQPDIRVDGEAFFIADPKPHEILGLHEGCTSGSW